MSSAESYGLVYIKLGEKRGCWSQLGLLYVFFRFLLCNFHIEGLVGCYLGSCSLSQLHYFCPVELTQHGCPLKAMGALCLHLLQRDALLPKAQ